MSISMSDEELENLSWEKFIAKITDTELITYLTERNLYTMKEE